MESKACSDVVYLEDIQPEFGSSRKKPENTSPSSSQTTASSTVTKKRQLTLQDMFSGSQCSEPSSKKIKLTSSVTSTASLSSGVTKLNSIAFSLPEFQASLTEEENRLLGLECELLGKSWLKLLKDEIRQPYFIALKRFLWTEGVKGAHETPSPRVYPPTRNIYSWSNTPLGRVKVVIIGQDPYHGQGQAHGLCFSVPKGTAVPPSLRNIYKELQAEYPDFTPPKHGNLTAWADNGVLMLNACLTVRAGSPASHSNKGWEEFTDKVVDIVDQYGGANLAASDGSQESIGRGRGIVFLAWGAFAAKRVAKLSKQKHLILTSTHPSPFSANKGFLGCGHFKRANEWLEERYGKDGTVDWCALE